MRSRLQSALMTARPNRSVMSIPGNVAKMAIKAAASDVDVAMLDLEDSVPVSAKAEARSVVVQSLKLNCWTNKTISVRINQVGTAFAHDDLIEVISLAGALVDSIVIPKVDSPGDVHFVDRLLTGLETGTNLPVGRIRIEASIESAEGLECVSQIAKSSSRLSALVFGIADFSASIGARLVSLSGHGEREEEIYPGHRWQYPLAKIVTAAKANGLLAIDAPFGNFKDAVALEKSAAMACALGCDGKWAIHPSQVNVINKVFSPGQEDVNRAARVLRAHELARGAGLGSTQVDGRMIDHATVRMATQLMQRAEALGMKADPEAVTGLS